MKKIIPIIILSGILSACGAEDNSDNGPKPIFTPQDKEEVIPNMAVAGDNSSSYVVWASKNSKTSSSNIYWLNVDTGKTYSTTLNNISIYRLAAYESSRKVVFADDKNAIYLLEIPKDADNVDVTPKRIVKDAGAKVFNISASKDFYSYATLDPDDSDHSIIWTHFYSEKSPLDIAHYKTKHVSVAAYGEKTCVPVAWDAPNGVIECYTVAGDGSGNTQKETLESGLSSPMAVALSDVGHCWSGMGKGMCRSYETNDVTQMSHTMTLMPTSDFFYLYKGNLFYFATDTSRIVRYDLKSQTTSNALPASQGSTHPVVVKDNLYWHSLNKVYSANAWETHEDSSKPSTPSIPTGLCSSSYSGRWAGTFDYILNDMETGDRFRQATIPVEITLSCLADVSGTTTLTVTEAKIGHEFFGCTDGCTPNTGSVAMIPNAKGSTSKAGESISLLLPNNTTFATKNEAGDLRVSADGKTLSNSGDCNADQTTWSAASLSGDQFNVVFGKTYTLFTPCWSLTKQ